MIATPKQTASSQRLQHTTTAYDTTGHGNTEGDIQSVRENTHCRGEGLSCACVRALRTSIVKVVCIGHELRVYDENDDVDCGHDDVADGGLLQQQHVQQHQHSAADDHHQFVPIHGVAIDT